MIVRWVSFGICLLFVLICQTTLASQVGIWDVRPDWLLVLVVFFSLYSTRVDAAIAGWVIGLAADMTSVERVGLSSMTYLVAALMVNSVRDMVFLRNAGTHFVVTLSAGLMVQLVISLYRAWRLAAYEPWQHLALEGALVALYSAFWAIPIHSALSKCLGAWRSHSASYARAGSSQAGAKRV